MVKDFPLNSIEKLAKKAGCERIAKEAINELKSILLEISENLAKEAVALCKHAKRVTVKREDILLAEKAKEKI